MKRDHRPLVVLPVDDPSEYDHGVLLRARVKHRYRVVQLYLKVAKPGHGYLVLRPHACPDYAGYLVEYVLVQVDRQIRRAQAGEDRGSAV